MFLVDPQNAPGLDDAGDPLAPARGCLVGLVAGLCGWAALAAGVGGVLWALGVA